MQDLRRAARINALSGHGLDELLNIAIGMINSATILLTVGFLLHLILRGFWIGAVGLRSVSGDFDFEVLGYHRRYEQWLRGSLGSFDQFIEQLEVRSSIAFSVAFLLFFIIISLGMYTLVGGLVGGLVVFVFEWGNFGKVGGAYAVTLGVPALLFFLLYLLAGIFYVVDFITLGALKKVAWLRYLYYPVYRFMGWVTLARFYRPFYYNLIDHPFGRRLVRWTFPLMLAMMAYDGIQIGRNVYLPLEDDSIEFIRPNNYLTAGDQLDYKLPSLATYYPTSDYLEVFIPYVGEDIDGIIQQRFPEVRPSITGVLGFGALYDIEDYVDTDSLLMAVKEVHQIRLNDSVLVDVPWKFYRHPEREQPGLLYGLPIYDLDRGEHCLHFQYLDEVKQDSFGWEDWTTLCFLR